MLDNYFYKFVLKENIKIELIFIFKFMYKLILIYDCFFKEFLNKHAHTYKCVILVVLLSLFSHISYKENIFICET